MNNNSQVTKVCDLVQARIPTPYGDFQLHYYRNNKDSKEHLALIKGDVINQCNVPVRLHSECFTGDVLGSKRCDCGEQLTQAMEFIHHQPCGVIIYLRQEGRGIGLFHKLQAYNLQDEGFDTLEANLHLGFAGDEREYSVAAAILRKLNIQSINLLTNNPTKLEALIKLNIIVSNRIPLEILPQKENENYIHTKVSKMGHLNNLMVGKS